MPRPRLERVAVRARDPGRAVCPVSLQGIKKKRCGSQLSTWCGLLWLASTLRFFFFGFFFPDPVVVSSLPCELFVDDIGTFSFSFSAGALVVTIVTMVSPSESVRTDDLPLDRFGRFLGLGLVLDLRVRLLDGREFSRIERDASELDNELAQGRMVLGSCLGGAGRCPLAFAPAAGNLPLLSTSNSKLPSGAQPPRTTG